MKKTGKAGRIIIALTALLAAGSFIWMQFLAAEYEPCASGGFWDESARTCVYPEKAEAPALSSENEK